MSRHHHSLTYVQPPAGAETQIPTGALTAMLRKPALALPQGLLGALALGDLDEEDREALLRRVARFSYQRCRAG